MLKIPALVTCALGGLLLLSATALAEACTLQIGSDLYQIEPAVDHRPESEQHLCTDGMLKYYDNALGW